MTCCIIEHQWKHCAATLHTHAALLPHSVRYGISIRDIYGICTEDETCILSTNINGKVERSSTTRARTGGMVPFSKGDFVSLTLNIEI